MQPEGQNTNKNSIFTSVDEDAGLTRDKRLITSVRKIVDEQLRALNKAEKTYKDSMEYNTNKRVVNYLKVNKQPYKNTDAYKKLLKRKSEFVKERQGLEQALQEELAELQVEEQTSLPTNYGAADEEPK